MHVVIMRGITGSGKSTHITRACPGTLVVSAVATTGTTSKKLSMRDKVTFLTVLCDPNVARKRTKHATSMDQQPGENVRNSLWRQHQKVCRLPDIDGTRVRSEVIWTSEKPAEDFKPPPKRPKRNGPKPDQIQVRLFGRTTSAVKIVRRPCQIR